MYEIVISHVFDVCYGSSTGPERLLFKRFQKNWDTIDEEHFEIDEEVLDIGSACKKRSDQFLPRPFEKFELLEICNYYLLRRWFWKDHFIS